MFSKSFFRRASLWTLIFVLLSILWGAWTRISHSGDGCGDRWPLCGPGLLPEGGKALVEWIHRLSSGLSLLMVLGLFALALKVYPKGHAARKFSLAALLLIISEALIGAVLVLARLTAMDMSALRAAVLSFHLINSLLLAGALALCHKAALAKSGAKIEIQKPLFYFALAFPLLALAGNIASLAGTLFPAESLKEALAMDFQPSAHIALRIRPLHPLLAFAFTFWLLGAAKAKKSLRRPAAATAGAALFGLATLLSLSPVWMKLTHLLTAYLLWIFLVSRSLQLSDRHK